MKHLTVEQANSVANVKDMDERRIALEPLSQDAMNEVGAVAMHGRSNIVLPLQRHLDHIVHGGHLPSWNIPDIRRGLVKMGLVA